MTEKATTFTLEIRPEGKHPAPAIIRLRRLLKTMLRAYGFRCTNIKETGSSSSDPPRAEKAVAGFEREPERNRQ